MSGKIKIEPSWYRDNLPIESKDLNAINAVKGFINNKRIKTVGILGDYGSGKSSLINALKKENENAFLVLKVPNYIQNNHELVQTKSIDDEDDAIEVTETTNTNFKNSYDCKAEVRKSLTLQLLSACKDNTKKFSIQRKLLIHNFQRTSKIDVVLTVTIILSLSILLLPDFLSEHIDVVKNNIELFTVSSLLILLVSTVTIIVRFINFLKNERWTNLSISKLSMNKDNQNSYLDYDLETIIVLINLWKGKNKNKVIVIEDVDRFGDLTIFQELTPIIHSCLDIKFIIPVKEGIFEGEEQLSKYFDSTYTMLPVNDKMKFQEHVEGVLHENDGILSVDTSLLITTTPHIKDYRTFNLVYNRYLTLVDNYQKVCKTISQADLNTLYTIAVLQVLIPNQTKNTTLNETELSIYLKKLFKTNNILDHFTAENRILIKKINKNIAALNEQFEEKMLDLCTFDKFEEKQVIKFLNEILHARIHNVGGTYNVSGTSVSVYNMRAKIARNNYYNIEELREINKQLGEPFDFEFIDRFYNSEKKKAKEVEVDELEKRIRKEKQTIEKENNKLKKRLAHIEGLSLVELNELYQMDAYYDSAVTGLEKVDLINELVKKGYLTEKWTKFISPTGSSDSEMALREFKYDKINSISDEYFENIIKGQLKINDALIDTFQVADYSDCKFIRADIINYLLKNVDRGNNSLKLKKVIDTITGILELDSTAEYSHKESEYEHFIQQASQKTQIIAIKNLFDDIKLNIESEVEKQVNFIKDLLNIAFYLNSEISVDFINDLMSIQLINSNVYSEMRHFDIFWAYFEFSLNDLDEEIMSAYCAMVHQDDELSEKIIILEKLINKLDENEYIEGKIWKCNEANIAFILEKKGISPLRENQNAIKFISKNIIIPLFHDTRALDEFSSTEQIINNLDNLKNFIKYYKYKYEDISIFTNNEIKVHIIKNRALLPNEKNFRVLIENESYEELYSLFSLTEEYVNEDDYKELFEYALNAGEIFCAEKYAKSIGVQFDLPENYNEENAFTMLQNKCINTDIQNFKKVKSTEALLQMYLRGLTTDELEQHELDAKTQITMYDMLLFAERYEDINIIFKTYKNHNYKELDTKFSYELNISILKTEVVSDKQYNLFKIELGDSVSAFVELFEQESFTNFIKYETPSYSAAKKNKSVIVGNLPEKDRIALISRMYNNLPNINLEQINKLLSEFELSQIFTFNSSGAGSRNKSIEFDKDGYVEEFCQILEELNYLESYNIPNGNIRRKYL
ncbi:hypothetical protein R2F61_05505 [Mollicutes bacterium LVI A0078]|nr:hypothetical protein RZE84_05525 [Mollicutes bacterium LVI A0075]WOO90186.1 hypothetical protein R2F61_05505 [Mollicutes bacterium LVI A0078]